MFFLLTSPAFDINKQKIIFLLRGLEKKTANKFLMIILICRLFFSVFTFASRKKFSASLSISRDDSVVKCFAAVRGHEIHFSSSPQRDSVCSHFVLSSKMLKCLRRKVVLILNLKVCQTFSAKLLGNTEK